MFTDPFKNCNLAYTTRTNAPNGTCISITNTMPGIMVAAKIIPEKDQIEIKTFLVEDMVRDDWEKLSMDHKVVRFGVQDKKFYIDAFGLITEYDAELKY